MNIGAKYPIAYTQRFSVIDARLADLQNQINQIDTDIETARYLQVSEDNGYITISLLDKNEVLLSSINIAVTEKIIISCALDMEDSQLVFTCLDGSTINCDISQLTSSALSYDDTLAILRGEE